MAVVESKDPRLAVYNTLRVVGQGSYGEVFLVRKRGEKKQYVMKNIKLAMSSAKERLAAEQEAALLSKLQHPNIVSYKESFQDELGMLHIVMGYCEGGDLCSRLKTYHGRLLPEAQVVEWFVQIALALQYLHERNILHRDLKTQNIFLSKNDIVKVGDLGIARVLDGSCDLAHTVIGTPYYMSPELFANQPYNHKSDVWALGCCVYEMATLRHAFTARNINALMHKIVRGKVPPLPAPFSPELCSLVQAMLSRSTKDRPGVHQILRMEYIRQHIKLFLDKAANRRRRSHQSTKTNGESSSVEEKRVVGGGGRRGEGEAVCKPQGRRRSSSDATHCGSSSGQHILQPRPSPPEPHPPPPDPCPPHFQHLPPPEPHSSSLSHQPNGRGGEEGGGGGEITKGEGGGGKREGEGGSLVDNPETTEKLKGRNASKRLNHGPRPLPPDPVIITVKESSPANCKPPPSPVVVSSARERRRKHKAQEAAAGCVRGRVVLKSRSSSDVQRGAGSREERGSRPDRLQAIPRSYSSPHHRQSSPPTAERERAASDGGMDMADGTNGTDTESLRLGQAGHVIETRLSCDQPSRTHQPSFQVGGAESESEGGSTPSLTGEPADSEPSLESSGSHEVNEFFTLLDSTLHLPEASPADSAPDSTPQPRIAFATEGGTMLSGRLTDRAAMLKRECLEGLGAELFSQASRLLHELEPEEAEEALQGLLGRERCTALAGKLQELRLCEESLDGL